MATNPKPIIFKITEAGKQAALSANAATPKVQINLTQVAIGSGKYAPTGNETALKTEIMKGPIVSGDIEGASNTLRFSSAITSPTTKSVYEVGLLTDTGVLFAVAASPSDVLFTVHPDITFVISYGLLLEDIEAENITVTTDPNSALALVLMENHLSAPNPHPQYLLETEYTPFDDTVLKNYVLLNTYNAHILKYQELVTDYREHVATNRLEHKSFVDWQTDHTAMLGKDGKINDPHPQYVLKSIFDDAIAALHKRIDELDLTGGTGALLGRLELNISGRQGKSGGDSKVYYSIYTTENFNLVPVGMLAGDSPIPNVSVSGLSSWYRDGTGFYLEYPEGFDPAIHELKGVSSQMISETEDGKGIKIIPVVSVTKPNPEENFYDYSINSSYRFDIVKK